ncbi:MAG: sigma-70 family RNA polymerase sigma factor [Bacteroidia bacterium]|nr:sigma-70 family RNA polymerase sigma factor [Bacteroidia bacterium]
MRFEDIYKEYWQKVFRICMGYVNDHDWAKDIAQETFISVFQQLSNFRNQSAIGTWIYRIAVNHCLRQIDKNNKFIKSSFPLEIVEEQQPDIEGKIAFLYKSISELPETDRIVISLELENVKQAEIALIVGLSEANVRVRIHRIKEKLTQKFNLYEQ